MSNEFESPVTTEEHECAIQLQTKMNHKKREFLSEDKRYVWFKGKKLLAEPESEYDTVALLWILSVDN